MARFLKMNNKYVNVDVITDARVTEVGYTYDHGQPDFFEEKDNNFVIFPELFEELS
jgi:hypothetical protein